MKFMKLNGSKTYAAGVGLIGYLAFTYIWGGGADAVDPGIVTGLLAAMGIALRHGMANGTPPAK